MVDTSFVNRGSDDALVKSLQEQGLVPEELSKAIDKSKLVQVEIQVQGKNGTFTRKQWKKAGDVKSTDKVVGGQAVGGNTKTTMTKQEFDKKYPNGNYQNPEDVYRRNGKNATWKGQPLSNPSVMKQAKADYQQFLKDKAALDANTKTQKASSTASSSGPVDISKFKFTNYRNPDGQNYTGRETFRGTLESVAKETERKAQNVVNSYSGAMTPEKQLRIAFDNINRHSTYRDLVDPSSEQGLKDAKKAISNRQRELIESVKDLTKWDGNKWIKDDSKKTEQPKKSDDTTKSWQSKIDAGSFTEAEKKALSYGVSEKHACLLGKDGDYKTAKTWDEADYAVKQGWTNLGSITQIISDGKVKSSKGYEVTKTGYEPFQIGANNVGSYVDNKKFPSFRPKPNSSSSAQKNYLIGQNIHQVLSGNSKEFVSETAKNEALRATRATINAHKKALKDSNYRDSLYSADSEQKIIDGANKLLDILKDLPVKSEKSDKKSGSSTSFEIPKTKDAIQKLVSSGVSKKDIMEQAKASGVTWKHNDHEGINWMRCCMAMTGTTTKGGKK